MADNKRERLLIIGLDGYEARIADALIEQGKLPNIERLLKSSAHLDVDHGRNKLTGLSWQHFATGQSPEDSGRWSAVDFDTKNYVASQPMGIELPFLRAAGERAVILDAPYFDLSSCPNMNGFVNWGAHDPGVAPFCRPDNLYNEILEKFGPYPAPNDIYAFVWNDAEATKQTAENLRKATQVRSQLTSWLLNERFPDWDLALTVVSELHSAIEPLWHGFDETHPLNAHPSAKPAHDGLVAIYEELDKMIGNLQQQFPDAALCLFWMHGMGSNDADVVSMILLPELLYRHTYDKPNFITPERWSSKANSVPMLEPGESWSSAVFDEMQVSEYTRPASLERATNKIKTLAASALGRKRDKSVSLDWMPSSGFSHAWEGMPAFALPSFYDGRIRLNVKGREAKGMIAPENYSQAMDEVEALLRECKCSRTGASIIREVHRTSPEDPFAVPKSNGDMEIIWDGEPLGIFHEKYGEIGPLPYRRTGGHTGGLGECLLLSDALEAGHYGCVDAMDISPTIAEWIGIEPENKVSGESFLSKLEGK